MYDLSNGAFVATLSVKYPGGNWINRRGQEEQQTTSRLSLSLVLDSERLLIWAFMQSFLSPFTALLFSSYIVNLQVQDSK